MKIINLMEDTAGERGCLCEHGLSFYIETKHHKLLLDTGASDRFLANAQSLGIDIAQVDTVIISHGHYDHTGGLLAFAACNEKAAVYIHRKAQGEYYSLKASGPKYIGIAPEIAALKQVIFLGECTAEESCDGRLCFDREGKCRLDEELTLFTGVSGRRLWPRGNEALRRKSGEELVQDTFDHEQYLVVREGDKTVLLSGCAHNGILNILDKYRELYGGEPTHVISGFHTVRKEYTAQDDAIIEQIGYALAETGTSYYSGHCTGEYPMQILKRILGERLTVIHSGDIVLD